MPFDISGLSFALWILLIPYAIFLLFFIVYSAFNLYHLLRFGTYGMGLYAITAVFLFGTFVLLASSYFLLAPIDWSVSVSPNAYFSGGAINREFFPGF